MWPQLEWSTRSELLNLAEQAGGIIAQFESVEVNSVMAQTWLNEKQAASIECENLNAHRINLSALYDHIDLWDPLNEQALKKAHRQLMLNLSMRAGQYRGTSVAIYHHGRNIYASPPATGIARTLSELFTELNADHCHPLYRAALFFDVFESWQPFAEANGCITRFWLTLLMRSWHPLFQWLNIEQNWLASIDELAEARQVERNERSEAFILWLTGVLRTSMSELAQKLANCSEQPGADAQKSSDKFSDVCSVKGSEKWPTARKVLFLVNKERGISAQRIAELLGLSSRAVEKQFARLKQQGKLERVGSPRGGYWRVMVSPSQQLSLPEC
jgi:Fic family protein